MMMVQKQVRQLRQFMTDFLPSLYVIGNEFICFRYIRICLLTRFIGVLNKLKGSGKYPGGRFGG